MVGKFLFLPFIATLALQVTKQLLPALVTLAGSSGGGNGGGGGGGDDVSWQELAVQVDGWRCCWDMLCLSARPGVGMGAL